MAVMAVKLRRVCPSRVQDKIQGALRTPVRPAHLTPRTSGQRRLLTGSLYGQAVGSSPYMNARLINSTAHFDTPEGYAEFARHILYYQPPSQKCDIFLDCMTL